MLSSTLLSEKSNAVLAYCTNCHHGNTSPAPLQCPAHTTPPLQCSAHATRYTLHCHHGNTSPAAPMQCSAHTTHCTVTMATHHQQHHCNAQHTLHTALSPWQHITSSTIAMRRFSVPTRVLNPKGISIGSAVFANLTSVID